MMHAPAHLLVEFADGELQGKARAELLRHLNNCASCEAAVFELKATRSSFAALLGELDEAEPDVWTPSIEAIYAPAQPAQRRHAAGRIWRWAAGIALLSGAAAAGAAMLRQATREVPDSAPIVARETGSPASAAIGSGVFVTAENNRAQIELNDVAPGTRILIGMTTDSMIGVHAMGESSPNFVARSGHVLVRLNGRPAQLRMTVPASLANLLIVVNGKTIGMIENGRLDITAPDPRITLEQEDR